MNYKIKWIEENLGITRNMIRRYEKEGLLQENKEGRDREFSEEDLSKLWKIRVFLKMGFSLMEIRAFLKDEGVLDETLKQKIKELEKKKKELDQQLSFLKVMDTTGKLPSAFMQSYTQFETIYQFACQQYKAPIEQNIEGFWINVEEILWLHKCLMVKDKNQESKKRLNEMYQWFQSNKQACTKEVFAENFASHMQDPLFLILFRKEGCRFLKEVFLRFGKIERRE